RAHLLSTSAARWEARRRRAFAHPAILRFGIAGRRRSPAWLHLLIIVRLHRTKILTAAPARIARLGVPIALVKGAEEAVVAPEAAVRNLDIDGRLARDEAALRLIAQHRDELG